MAETVTASSGMYVATNEPVHESVTDLAERVSSLARQVAFVTDEMGSWLEGASETQSNDGAPCEGVAGRPLNLLFDARSQLQGSLVHLQKIADHIGAPYPLSRELPNA